MDPSTAEFLAILQNPTYAFLLFLVTAWSLAWRGVALWKASRNNHRYWFIALLLINTVGILDMVYIFYFQPKPPKQVEQKPL